MDLTNLKDRACAIEQEAFLTLATPKELKTFNYYFATSEKLPYTTHRIQGLPINYDGNSETEAFLNPRLVIRVVVGHLTDKYRGENDAIIDTYISLLVPYFANRKWFQSVAYPTRPLDLIYSEPIDAGGFMVFDNRGFAGVSQVGFELVIACRFPQYVDQVYL